jgi:hypothetical protein
MSVEVRVRVVIETRARLLFRVPTQLIPDIGQYAISAKRRAVLPRQEIGSVPNGGTSLRAGRREQTLTIAVG